MKAAEKTCHSDPLNLPSIGSPKHMHGRLRDAETLPERLCFLFA